MVVRPVILIFGIGKECRLAVNITVHGPMKNLIHADNLASAWHRQHSQRGSIQHGEDSRVYADAQGNRQDGNRRESRTSSEHP